MTLPTQIDPYRLARSGEHLSGRVGLAAMSRIPESVPHPLAAADVVLRFHLGDDARPRIEGELRARLQVRCQRCLEPVLIEVTREIKLMPVATDAEAAAVDADYEPLLVDADAISVARLVEDEIILSMPGYPRHPAGECSPPAGADPEAVPAPARGDNPFAVLRSLKGRDDDGEQG
ncbi:MAG: YceD family protein [Gammaproteobacteria bacterium]|nr:YceD family protein [Gammaproteobacteria bacterium]